MSSDSTRAKAQPYRQAGVDLSAGEQAVALMRDAVQSTYGPEVLAGIGAFGGLYSAAGLQALHEPVLVSSTDGVGTKTRIAAALGRWESIGRDLVHHCVDDILVQGARPLFFLDYVAAARLEPGTIATIVGGAAAACREAGMALLGGETAEMPGIYQDGQVDVAGTVVGVVERAAIVDGRRIAAGDQVLAFMSGGLQTNGYSLARQVLQDSYGELLGAGTVGDALLAPHRSYLRAVSPLLEAGLVRGMAHVTGGGIPGNLPRVLPSGLGARIDGSSWPIPDIFELIAERGSISRGDMFDVFNMGAGFLVVVAERDVDAALALAPEALYSIGSIVEGEGVRVL
ncbi:MAG TPA: phosphoribosylformylglycinamidine cyclo-ligase [Trueperaceae bacterium]